MFTGPVRHNLPTISPRGWPAGRRNDLLFHDRCHLLPRSTAKGPAHIHTALTKVGTARSALPRPMPSAATQHGEGSSSYPYCADESRDVRAVDIEAAFGCRSSAPFTVPHPTNTGCEQRAEDGCLEGYQRRQRGRAGESHSLEPEEDGSNYIRRAFDRAAERGSRIVFEPAEGMIFSTEQEAYQFYNTYSWEMGFGIKYGNKYEIKKTGYKTNQDFLCSCEVSLLCHSSFNFFF
ncbi:uncharacterized protein LOC119336026 isoform X3 [Triticum dicoccoides]|uniref:uncharacterized protein LOC119336026 isoform X3 n=1 Tax=Triticum dicoccoides TaxID=85692 RepID=UPI001891BF30|nr:uncharacterized protein LOC119336026 isoform X3 [Triticum dicoccoides]